jgi:hypothetical protein
MLLRRSMNRPQTINTAVTTKPIQFIVPQRAVDAIDIGALVREATEDGVARPLIDVIPFGTHAGWVRVTCAAEMTIRLLNAWRDVVGRTALDAFGEERLAALRRAAVSAYRAYDLARAKPQERRPR